MLPLEHVKQIESYFPNLTDLQRKQFGMLKCLYDDWNNKINVISRKDMDSLYEHHVLHSLAIAKYVYFKAGSKILDVGTGGGFPGIPLAILFPEVSFKLIDSIGKRQLSGYDGTYLLDTDEILSNDAIKNAVHIDFSITKPYSYNDYYTLSE